MPWREVSVRDEREEFVRLALQEGANRRELCRRFGISPEVGYKWLRRWSEGDRELGDRSRRPHNSPGASSAETAAAVLRVRDAHPAWGARKIGRCLEREGIAAPALSTIHGILSRNGRIRPPPGGARATLRFEKPEPNLLWQMDFKGWITTAQQRCHPLTVIDDHSRFALCLSASADQQGGTVKSALERTFRRYGLPEAFFVDNGTPWGDPSGQRWTRLGVWLLKLGIDLIHSRPYHPQSRGKNERFHRTLVNEVFALERFRGLAEVQKALDAWRSVYNFERPHQALGDEVPASRYRPSQRALPDRLPEPDYAPGRDRPRRLHHQGLCQLQGTALEGPAGFPWRARRHPPARPRRPPRRLLRNPPHRHHRLDYAHTCQRCLRTGVSHLPGLNNKPGNDR